jgi:hypothetical protein
VLVTNKLLKVITIDGLALMTIAVLHYRRSIVRNYILFTMRKVMLQGKDTRIALLSLSVKNLIREYSSGFWLQINIAFTQVHPMINLQVAVDERVSSLFRI